MIHQNIKDLAEETDAVVNKFVSLNYKILDTEGAHTLMVFMLARKGYTLHAVSPTRSIASAQVALDDVFSLDEHLQDLSTLCEASINKSRRYAVAGCE